MESGKLTFGELSNYVEAIGHKICLYDADTNESRVFERTETFPDSYKDKYVINIKLSDKDPDKDPVIAFDESSIDIYLSSSPKESVENKVPDYNARELKFCELKNYLDSSVRLILWEPIINKESNGAYKIFGSKAVAPDTYNEKYVIYFRKYFETFNLADVPEKIARKKETNKDVSEEELLKGPAFADCIEVMLSDYPIDEHIKIDEELRLKEEAELAKKRKENR